MQRCLSLHIVRFLGGLKIPIHIRIKLMKTGDFTKTIVPVKFNNE